MHMHEPMNLRRQRDPRRHYAPAPHRSRGPSREVRRVIGRDERRRDAHDGERERDCGEVAELAPDVSARPFGEWTHLNSFLYPSLASRRSSASVTVTLASCSDALCLDDLKPRDLIACSIV